MAFIDALLGKYGNQGIAPQQGGQQAGGINPQAGGGYRPDLWQYLGSLGAGIAQASAPSTMPKSFGQIAAAGAMSGQQNLERQRQLAMEQQREAQRQKMQELQLQKYQKDLEGGGVPVGGATGELATRLMQSQPGMTFPQALHAVQSGFRSGTVFDPDTGTLQPISGAAETFGVIEGGKVAGKKQAELEAVQPISDAKFRAEVSQQLPTLDDEARKSIEMIRKLKTHPGVTAIAGAPNLLKGGLGFTNIPGTPAAGAQALFNTIGGKKFMSARQGLKGAGPVTDFEGRMGSNAIVALEQAQSDEEFIEGLNNFERIIKEDLATQYRKAGKQPPQWLMNELGMGRQSPPTQQVAPPLPSPFGEGVQQTAQNNWENVW